MCINYKHAGDYVIEEWHGLYASTQHVYFANDHRQAIDQRVEKVTGL